MSPLAASAAATVLSAAAWLGVRLSNVDWNGWRPATCRPADCFCEALHAGAVVQPANTWSCLAFIALGAWIMAAPRKTPSRLESGPAYPIVYGAAVIFIGWGSAFYHASLSFAGQWFDLMGMYLLVTFLILFNAARLGRLGPRTFAAVYLALNGALGVFLVAFPLLRRQMFAASVLILLASELTARRRLRVRMETRWLAASMSALLAAFGIWWLDRTRIVCSPNSPLQGHAAWHVLCAAAAGLLYRYYRSEAPVEESPHFLQ